MYLENVEDIYTLSPTQQGMLFHTLSDQRTGAYFQQIVYTLHGALDAAAFRRAWQQVVDRHPALRSTAGFTVRRRSGRPSRPAIRRQYASPGD